jgi:transposase
MFGVKYHPSRVARILHRIGERGWSVQKSVRVAARQDEEAVGEWKEKKRREEKRREVALAKKWVGEGRTILFVDESGFYLLCGLVRTRSPVGQRPLLREWVSRDHLSAICGITEGGELYFWQQEKAFDGDGVVGFVKQLLEQIPGRVGIVWDAAPIHRGEAVRQCLADGGSERLELVMLPGYSPELNPAEGVWSYLKGVLLANVVCHSVSQLWQVLTDAVRRLKSDPFIIQGCFLQPGCY